MRLMILLLLLPAIGLPDVFTSITTSVKSSCSLRDYSSSGSSSVADKFSGFRLKGGIFTENGYEISIIYNRIKGQSSAVNSEEADLQLDGVGLEFGKVVSVGAGRVRFECSAGMSGIIYPFKKSSTEEYFKDNLIYQLALYGDLRVRVPVSRRLYVQLGYKYEWPFRGYKFQSESNRLLRQRFLYLGVSF